MLDDLLHAVVEYFRRTFGAKEEPAPKRLPRHLRRPGVKQVYEGPEAERPAFAVGADQAELQALCRKHIVCEYKPHIEVQRIYRAVKRGPEGDLEVQYEGIAGSCTAIKHVGLAVAKEDGYVQKYRYVDLNHVFACCCGDPTTCRFYQKAHEERRGVKSQLRLRPGSKA